MNLHDLNPEERAVLDLLMQMRQAHIRNKDLEAMIDELLHRIQRKDQSDQIIQEPFAVRNPQLFTSLLRGRYYKDVQPTVEQSHYNEMAFQNRDLPASQSNTSD